MSLPGEVSPAASAGEAPAGEAAGAAQAGPARDGGGDTVPTPAPTGDEARVAVIPGADAHAADSPAATDHEAGTGGTGGAPAADLPPEVARLASAVADLDDLGELPVPEHVGRYDAVHGQLSEALASIDEV